MYTNIPTRMFGKLPIEITEFIFEIAEIEWVCNESRVVGSGKVNTRCSHILTSGPRRGLVCGVRCRVNEGGKCAKHGSGPMFIRKRESNIVRYKRPPPLKLICKN